MKMFRWSGLIGFAVVITAVLVIGFFFIDNWVKAGIEAGGTRVNGAEVNVGDVDLTFSPLGFRVEDLRITNADRPTHNLFELDEARLELRLTQLFFGRINIDAMIVDGMRSGTERERLGRVLAEPESDDDAGDGGGGSGDEPAGTSSNRRQLPEPQQVARSALGGTRAAADQAGERLSAAADNVEQAFNNLPDEASLDEYDNRLDALGERRLNSIEAVRRTRDDLAALADQAGRDQLSVANARQAAREAVSSAENALQEVLEAPAQDWAALRADYPLNAATATRLGRLLIGDTVFDQVEQLQTWYRQVSPWLERLAPERSEDSGPQRLEGRYVRFPTDNPSPNFLLREGLIGFEADGRPWRISLDDVTGQQRLIGRPVRLAIVKGDADDPNLRIEGVLDRRSEQREDRFELFGRDLGLGERQLAVSDAQLNWVPGRTDLTGEVRVIDNRLDGELLLRFSGSEFQAGGSNRTAALLNQALASVENFELGIDVDGRVDSPELSLTSDLDNQLNQALSRVVREEYERWLSQARASLDAEVDSITAPLRSRVDDIRAERDAVQARADAFQQEVTERIEAERNRLNRRLRQLEEEAENAIRDQVEDQIKDLDLPF